MKHKTFHETCKTYEPLIVFLKIILQGTTTKKLNNNMNQIFIFNFIYLFISLLKLFLL